MVYGETTNIDYSITYTEKYHLWMLKSIVIGLMIFSDIQISLLFRNFYF